MYLAFLQNDRSVARNHTWPAGRRVTAVARLPRRVHGEFAGIGSHLLDEVWIGNVLQPFAELRSARRIGGAADTRVEHDREVAHGIAIVLGGRALEPLAGQGEATFGLLLERGRNGRIIDPGVDAAACADVASAIDPVTNVAQTPIIARRVRGMIRSVPCRRLLSTG